MLSLSPDTSARASLRPSLAARQANFKSFRVPMPEDLTGIVVDAETEKRELRQERRRAFREWHRQGDLKRLARRLDIKNIIAAISREGKQGEYISSRPDWTQWSMSRERCLKIGRRRPNILVDVLAASRHASDVRGALAHEIGHHIDFMANGWFVRRQPTARFASAFKRGGFWIQRSDDPFSERIAETLGQYLCGHKLNAALLYEVRRVFAKLEPKHAKMVEEFRRANRGLNLSGSRSERPLPRRSDKT